MVIKGGIKLEEGDLNLESLPFLIRSEKYLDAVNLLEKCIEKNDPKSDKCKELIFSIMGDTLNKATETSIECGSTSSNYENLLYYSDCLIKICSMEKIHQYFQDLCIRDGHEYNEDLLGINLLLIIGLSLKGEALFHLENYQESIKYINKAINLLDPELNFKELDKYRKDVFNLKELCEEKIRGG